MNILDRDILKYILLVVIGYMVCKLFLNSHEGFTCDDYKTSLKNNKCDDQDNPSYACCNIVSNLENLKGCLRSFNNRHDISELNTRVQNCKDNPSSSIPSGSIPSSPIPDNCFLPGSEYTFGRCCDQSKAWAARGDPTCWGGGYDFASCCNTDHPLYKLMNHYDNNENKLLDMNELLLILTDILGDDVINEGPKDIDGDGRIGQQDFIESTPTEVTRNILENAGVDTNKPEFNLRDLELLVNYLNTDGMGYHSAISDLVKGL